MKETSTPLASPGAKILDSNVEQQSKEDMTNKNCSTCNKHFNSQYAYTRHLCHCKSAVMECLVCETKFANGNQMKSHILECHGGKLWTCSYEGCFRCFGMKKGMTYHLGEHVNKQFTCNSCNEEFLSAEELNTHKREANKVFVSNVKAYFRGNMKGTDTTIQHALSTLIESLSARFAITTLGKPVIFCVICRKNTIANHNIFVPGVFSISELKNIFRNTKKHAK